MEQINFMIDGEVTKAYYSDELSYGHPDEKYVLVYSYHGIHAVIRMPKDKPIDCATEQYLDMIIHREVAYDDIPDDWDDEVLAREGMMYTDAQGVIYKPDALDGIQFFREVSADKIMLAITTKD